jgi:hypothetical protein
MIWITPQGHFLIQGEVYPIYLSLSGQGITLPTGEVIHAAPAYVEMTPDGDIVHTYSGPLTSTLDDYLYVSNIHVVLGSGYIACCGRKRSTASGSRIVSC